MIERSEALRERMTQSLIYGELGRTLPANESQVLYITDYVIFLSVMTGNDVRDARKAHGWSQADLARKLEVTQAYVSLLESNRRVVPRRRRQRLASALQLSASKLPVSSSTEPLPRDRVARMLGTLGYPGFAHLGPTRALNPAELLVRTLRQKHVESRVVEALPWVLVRFPELDWDWLVLQAKQHDLQNRLGFVVTLARELAERENNLSTANVLRKWERALEHSRLLKDDAFAGDALTHAERRWLLTNRSAEAAHWNVLSNVSVETLALG